MAKVTITVPTDKVDEILSAIGYREGYEGTKVKFFREYIAQHLKTRLRKHRINSVSVDTDDVEITA